MHLHGNELPPHPLRSGPWRSIKDDLLLSQQAALRDAIQRADPSIEGRFEDDLAIVGR